MSGGATVTGYDSPYHGDYAMCGDLWLSEDGARIFTKCGNVFRATATRTTDMTYAGALEATGAVRHVADSHPTSPLLRAPAASPFGTGRLAAVAAVHADADGEAIEALAHVAPEAGWVSESYDGEPTAPPEASRGETRRTLAQFAAPAPPCRSPVPV